ncbi:hypothetical protein BY996DRAFT_8391280 [Phakopsora pachyrhizi]|nr:hypothetical protein BY996DRAFT_8391280 [Phakopsora pachyrhizi]
MLSSPAVASLQTFPKTFSFSYDSVNLVLGLIGQGWVQRLVGRAGRGLAGTKLRPVLKPKRQAEGFWVKAVGVENLQDVDHVAVVEKASFDKRQQLSNDIMEA